MEKKLSGAGLFSKDRRLGIITSQWHGDLVNVCESALRDELLRLDVDVDTIATFVRAPGALEFPLIAKTMAETGSYAAIAVIALVVDGGIYRHDFVASAVIDGIVRVSLDTGVPVLSASLTPHHFHEHEAHVEFFRNHFLVKGQELARACVGAVSVLDSIKSGSV